MSIQNALSFRFRTSKHLFQVSPFRFRFLLLSSVGQVQAHDAVVRLQDGRVGCEVGGGARVWLDVDAPQVGVQAEGAERTFLAQQLDLVDDLCTSVVPGEEPEESQ